MNVTTMSRQDKAADILDSAERMVRQGGYNGFSYRDVAADVGIKSSSVHYHFPTKEALCETLARRYTQRFIEALGQPSEQSSARSGIEKYISLYHSALVDDGLMCLCGVMGAEYHALPELVRNQAKSFFEENITWLEQVLKLKGGLPEPELRHTYALRIIATLEGAMILSQTLENDAYFMAAVAGLLDF